MLKEQHLWHGLQYKLILWSYFAFVWYFLLMVLLFLWILEEARMQVK